MPLLACYVDAGMGVGDLNLGPPVCVASTLPAKPFSYLLESSILRKERLLLWSHVSDTHSFQPYDMALPSAGMQPFAPFKFLASPMLLPPDGSPLWAAIWERELASFCQYCSQDIGRPT